MIVDIAWGIQRGIGRGIGTIAKRWVTTQKEKKTAKSTSLKTTTARWYKVRRNGRRDKLYRSEILFKNRL